ncbi:LacI family DNA-binding transcriptional regulator [uncultured Sphingomonas sp.]|uniref:LacI family DNA-binding transcriptional regulator n=1 Tax=uncultured Sphingomonas sp. TaxID=158754 RepID=UPI0025EDD3E4|nr:LacI family DNA-binding transcriptional regulator [uncultured Sphingomonas sp.]
MARAPRRSSKAITMATVAEHAGVSTMTVSNVIRGRNVQPALRDAVNRAIRELNYRPNAAAQALASANALKVGIAYRNSQNAFLSALLVGALNAATELGAQLMLHQYATADQAGSEESIRALLADGCNALLLPPPLCEIISGSAMRAELTVPVIALSPGSELPDMPAVRIDDARAARDMTQHLIELGHRRIGFIRAPDFHIVSRTRLEGYREALAGGGIAFDPALVADGDLTFDSGLVAAEALLDLPQPPTAIFASNDDMAAAVVSLAHRRGMHIPDDLSVAGFDDSPIAVKIWPTLTTIRQPIVDIAERAVQLLAQGTADGTSYLHYELIHRPSTAAPRP